MNKKAGIAIRTVAIIPVVAATLFFAKQLQAENPSGTASASYSSIKPRPDSTMNEKERTDTTTLAMSAPISGDGNNHLTLEGARALKAELDSTANSKIMGLNGDSASKAAFGAAKWILNEYYNAGYRCLISGHLDMALEFASSAEGHLQLYSGPSSGPKSVWKSIAKIYELRGIALLGKGYQLSLLGNDYLDRFDKANAAREFESAEPFFKDADKAAKKAVSYDTRRAFPYYVISAANEALATIMQLYADKEMDNGKAEGYWNQAERFSDLAGKYLDLYNKRRYEERKSGYDGN